MVAAGKIRQVGLSLSVERERESGLPSFPPLSCSTPRINVRLWPLSTVHTRSFIPFIPPQLPQTMTHRKGGRALLLLWVFFLSPFARARQTEAVCVVVTHSPTLNWIRWGKPLKFGHMRFRHFSSGLGLLNLSIIIIIVMAYLVERPSLTNLFKGIAIILRERGGPLPPFEILPSKL